MNLLYTITAYPPAVGGAQIHQHLLAQSMLERKHEIQVLSFWDSNRNDWLLGTTLNAPSESKDYIVDNIAVRRVGLSTGNKARMLPLIPLYYPLMSFALPRMASVLDAHFSEISPGAELIHNVRMGRESLSYASLKEARRRDIPFVLTPLHHPRWIGWRYQSYIELYKAADIILALTDSEAEILRELGVEDERIFITGIGPVLAPEANPKHFLDKYSLTGPMVLFLGQHYEYKGYNQLLEAAQFVWKQIPEAHFVFVGPPVGRSEEAFYKIQDKRVLRLGAVDLQTKTDALAACHLLCVPSTQESFGGVYTEAWSFAKPVIGCNIPAVSNVISNEVDGYLVSQDACAIAAKIVKLLSDNALSSSLGDAGQRKVKENYSWTRLASLTESAYIKALQV